MPDEAAEALQKYDPDNISMNAAWSSRSPRPAHLSGRGHRPAAGGGAHRSQGERVVGVFLLKERVGQS